MNIIENLQEQFECAIIFCNRSTCIYMCVFLSSQNGNIFFNITISDSEHIQLLLNPPFFDQMLIMKLCLPAFLVCVNQTHTKQSLPELSSRVQWYCTNSSLSLSRSSLNMRSLIEVGGSENCIALNFLSYENPETSFKLRHSWQFLTRTITFDIYCVCLQYL